MYRIKLATFNLQPSTFNLQPSNPPSTPPRLTSGRAQAAFDRPSTGLRQAQADRPAQADIYYKTEFVSLILRGKMLFFCHTELVEVQTKRGLLLLTRLRPFVSSGRAKLRLTFTFERNVSH